MPEKELSKATSLSAKKRVREANILKKFIEVFCHSNHKPENSFLCDDCQDLLQYALKRLEKCPYDPKPKCKDCPTHCYKSAYRDKIRSVMKFSGMYFIKRGRLDWMIKYFLT